MRRKDADGAAHHPNPKTLLHFQIFKEHILTDFGGDAKGYRNLNFQLVAHPKLYRFFTFSLPKFNSGLTHLPQFNKMVH
jgi:hypothetical protein